MIRRDHKTIEGFHHSNFVDLLNTVPLLDRPRSSSALWPAEEATASPRTPKQWYRNLNLEFAMGLKEEFRSAWLAESSFDELLARLVTETASRASGLWRLEENHLVLIGFGWARDMPLEVSSGFQAATRRVPLDQIGLGIVKAAVTAKPAIGRRDPNESGLDGSATWISRFGANTSLAVPIHQKETNLVIGVLAVSTSDFVEEGDSLWQTLISLADELGSAA